MRRGARFGEGGCQILLLLIAVVTWNWQPAQACDEHGWEWKKLAASNAPPLTRGFAYTVWTGKEMIRWYEIYPYAEGGDRLLTGRAYNPLTNSWRLVPGSSYLGCRSLADPVWSGREMLVWGGSNSSLEGPAGAKDLNTGAAYNPQTDTWRPLGTVGAPSARSWHVTLWTPLGMVVWGGQFEYEPINSGAIYDPEKDNWTAIPTVGAPIARTEPSAAWIDGELFLWGGWYFVPDGYVSARLERPDKVARYNPSTRTWKLDKYLYEPVITDKYAHGNAFTFVIGSNVYIWGHGHDPGSQGFTFDYTTNRWGRTLPFSSMQAGKPGELSAFWTGNEVLLWDPYGVGGHFIPESNAWKPAATLNAPKTSQDDLGRYHQYISQACWTGEELLAHTHNQGLFSYRPKCLNQQRRQTLGLGRLHPGHWVETDWLGWFNDLSFPWIYHQAHGWLYCAKINEAWAGLWDPSLGWLITGRQIYPFMYRPDSADWLYYFPGTKNPRWVYSYGEGAWSSW